MLDYNSDSDLQLGDILVVKDHVEIYAGDGNVFSCGDQVYLSDIINGKSVKMNPGGNVKIIRFK